MTPDELETRAQQIHAVRHRAGTGQVCGSCRDEAARTPQPALVQRLAYPRRPGIPGWSAFAAVLVLTGAFVLTGWPVPWFVALGCFAAQVWFLLGPPARSHIPSK